MRVGSLFAGIGGFDLGLERAGFEIAWQVEIAPYCQRVLAKHWPDVKRYGDIRAIDWGTVPRVDLLCGGFPCQDLSFAGKRAGIDGERSGLWSEYVRAIRALRPRYIIVENVPGLLTNEYMGRVLGDLAASGYDAEWDCLPASAFGAPHRRDRVWIVAHARSSGAGSGAEQSEGQKSLNGQPAFVLSDTGSGGRTPEAWNHHKDVADAARFRTQEPTRENRQQERGRILPCGMDSIGNGRPEQWATEPELGRVAYGVPHRVDRLRGLGNSIVPQIAEFLGRQIMKVSA